MKNIFILTALLSFLSTLIVSPQIQANEVNQTLKRIKQYYAFSEKFKRFRVTYHGTIDNAYQAYDYKNPSAGIMHRTVDINLNTGQFYRKTKITWPGDFIFHYASFKNDHESLRYDINGMLDGKKVRVLDENYIDNVWDDTQPLISFLAIQPLLNAQAAQITVSSESPDAITLTLHTNQQAYKRYQFDANSLALNSFFNSEDKTTLYYSDYVAGNNFHYARTIKYFANNEYKGIFNLSSVERISAIAPAKLRLPAGYGPKIVNSKSPQTVTNIAQDLYLITDESHGRNVLAKKYDKGLMVFGAPINAKRSEQVIALLSDKFPEQKITHVFISHAHSDHISGLAPYAEYGAKIIADEYTIEATKVFPRFEKIIDSFDFQPISHRETLNGVHFYSPKNSHSKGQSFAYFADNQVIYEGDFLEIPHDNTISNHMADVEKSFIEFIRAEKLAIKRIVGHHRNNNISPEIMNAFYQANTL